MGRRVLKMLTLDTIGLLDPKLSAAFEVEMNKVVVDAQERPAITKARTVTIKITVVPDPDKTGGGEVEGLVNVQVGSKIPARETDRAVKMRDGWVEFEAETAVTGPARSRSGRHVDRPRT